MGGTPVTYLKGKVQKGKGNWEEDEAERDARKTMRRWMPRPFPYWDNGTILFIYTI